MKPLLRSLLILSIALFSQSALAADPVPAAPTATQVAAASQDLRSRTNPALTTVQLAIGDGPTSAGSASLRDAARPLEQRSAEGLPSTPIALASLLLILCILIGRRNI